GGGGGGCVSRPRRGVWRGGVALKRARAGAQASNEALARFRIEAEAAARLQHPNIVPIYEIGEYLGCPYFSLEFLEGGSLAGRLGGKPWRCRPAAELIETLARAIHAAHERGIIHRDLKPANVLLAADGTPKISHFALAHQLHA